MANVLTFTFLFAVSLTSRVESCSISSSPYVLVPQTIPAGYQVTKVTAVGCDPNSLRLTVKDPSFAVQGDGALTALTPVSMAFGERTFSVSAQDDNGPGGEMEVHLVCQETQKKTNQNGEVLLKRTKRRWGPAPINIRENDQGPFPKFVETLVSDSAVNHSVFYTLSGYGAADSPFEVFILDEDNGDLSVTRALDREEISIYTLKVSAKDKTTHQERDEPLNFQIVVDDDNDNAPEFKGLLQLSVSEQTKGAVVGMVQAADRDDQNTDHAKFQFRLLSHTAYFNINPETGVITTIANTLDRETEDKHMVTIEVKDLKGTEGGLSNTATATIALLDINDNPPTFTKTAYTATVPENEKDKLILRIPVEDKDLPDTPNWISKFVIRKGNENGDFRIERDPKTNDGLLYVAKPLNYEKSKNVKLEILARNQAELNGTTAQWLSVPVDVAVTDVDEGPEFSPLNMRIKVKENTPNGTVIGTYKALDPETQKSDGIMYYKISDPGMWVNLDKNTGELKVANTIDRESDLVQDGLYNISVRAVDSSTKSGVGMVTLVIEDVNDNQPVIPSHLVLCEDKTDQLGSVLVVAEDRDLSPFSSPFSFNLLPEYKDAWSVELFNATAATLKQVQKLPRGMHEVPLIVKDLQGFGEKQTVKVTICQCQNGVCMAKKSGVALGPMGALALFLPLLLLLLLFLVLALFCLTKPDKIELEDAGYGAGILLPSNTEAPGEEVDSSLIIGTSMGIDQAGKSSIKGSTANMGWLQNKSMSTMGGQSMHDFGYQTGMTTTNVEEFSSGQYGQYGQYGQLLGNGMEYREHGQDNTFYETYRTNELILQQKIFSMGTEGEERFAEDVIHSYKFEGAGSDAGSVGCCSDYGGEKESFAFLDSLGPKFKSLADVCTKS
ncbi:desmocollin 2 like [Kryptolebias marmoratus]|uniref:Desmocollin 1 n=1 Tax=Kryptolebias marmoratus TaxID=37003 RepID=A0A3Q3AR77_KRYMA|nr:desmocollin 2 like [Kryptolebias marmoratus]